MKQKNVKVDELKAVIMALIKAGLAEKRELMSEVMKDFGPDEIRPNRDSLEVEDHFIDWLSSVFAGRLKHNSCPMLWFSHWHYAQFVALKIDAIAALEGVVLDKKTRVIYGALLKDGLRKNFDAARQLLPNQGKNLYKEYWRWIKAAFAEAEALGLAIEDFLATEGSTDLITKRILTKEQYGACYLHQCALFSSTAKKSGFTLKEVKNMKKIVNDFYGKKMKKVYGK